MFKVIFFVVFVIFIQKILTSTVEDDYDFRNIEKERVEEFVNKIKSSYNKDVDPCNSYVDYVTGNLEPIRKYISEPDIQVYKDIYNLTKSHLVPWDQMFNSCYYNLSSNYKKSDVIDVDLQESESFKLYFYQYENEEKWKWYDAYKDLISLAQQLGTDEPIYVAGHGSSTVPRISLPILMKFNLLDDKKEPKMFRDLFEYIGFASVVRRNFRTSFKNLQQKFMRMDNTLLDNKNSQYKNYMIAVNESYIDEFKQIFAETNERDLAFFLFYIMYGLLHETRDKIMKDKEICYKLTSLSLTYSFMPAIFKEYLNKHDKDDVFYQFLSNHQFYRDSELSVDLTSEIINEKWSWMQDYDLSDDYFFTNIMKVHKLVQDKDYEAYLTYFNLAYYIHNEPKIFMVFYMRWLQTNRFDPQRPGRKCDDYKMRQYLFTTFIKSMDMWFKRTKYNYDLTKQILDDHNLSLNKLYFTLVAQQLINQNWSDSEKEDFQNVLLESPEFLEEYKCKKHVITELDCENY